MNIDFGIVKKYFPDRGFGFITHTFLSDHQSELFFHIKNIKRTHPDLAERLGNEEPIGTIYFWYETEVTSKGEQIRTVLKSDAIHEMVTDNLPSFIDKIESNWRNIDSSIPVWLREVTVDLVGAERASELSLGRDTLERERREAEEKRRKERETLQKIEEAKRDTLERERREIEEKRRKERETLQKIEEAKRQKLIEEREIQEEIEEKEFEQLVAEMALLGFTHSNQVSRYIVENKLGYKYKNISGIVQMEQGGTTWDFKGGFPPKIYAELCEELGLRNQGTQARAVGFESFKDLEATRHQQKVSK